LATLNSEKEEEIEMLVLTRKIGEAIRIGDDVELQVVGVSRGRVRLGFKAPRNVAVQRAELPPRDAATEPAELSIKSVVPMLVGPKELNRAPLSRLRTRSGTGG
jgi:carbon storage regulator CsrA